MIQIQIIIMNQPKPCKCLRCGADWQTKLDRPRYCPICKSPRWDEPRRDPAGSLASTLNQAGGFDRMDMPAPKKNPFEIPAAVVPAPADEEWEP